MADLIYNYVGKDTLQNPCNSQDCPVPPNADEGPITGTASFNIAPGFSGQAYPDSLSLTSAGTGQTIDCAIQACYSQTADFQFVSGQIASWTVGLNVGSFGSIGTTSVLGSAVDSAQAYSGAGGRPDCTVSIAACENYNNPGSWTLVIGTSSGNGDGSSGGDESSGGDSTNGQGPGNVGAGTSSPSCASVLTNAVSHSLGGRSLSNNLFLSATSISATFTPRGGATSLAQAAMDCSINGYTLKGFDWEQTITSWPSPSVLYQVGNPVGLTAGGGNTFIDPPPGGYVYCAPGCHGNPFYYNPDTSGGLWSVYEHEDDDTLSFRDAPADSCLPYDNVDAVLRSQDDDSSGCDGETAPIGSYLAFKTQLVGVSDNNSLVSLSELGLDPNTDSFTWTDTFNGTSGGISVSGNINVVDSDSGTGGITITSIDGVSVVPESPSLPIFGGGVLLLSLVCRWKVLSSKNHVSR